MYEAARGIIYVFFPEVRENLCAATGFVIRFVLSGDINEFVMCCWLLDINLMRLI